MSDYIDDPRVVAAEGSYHVDTPDDRQWVVTETGGQWDAWPYPECVDPEFDDLQYFREFLAGQGALHADDKIYDLIGPPQTAEELGLCPGCVGRGTGTGCCMCGRPIPIGLRRQPGDPSEMYRLIQ